MAFAPTAPVPLPREFYAPSAEVVAPLLLGHYLLRRLDGVWAGGPIVEAEAYFPHDPASHGFKGQTPRNKTMFGPAGMGYVYLIYGYHSCFNAVCGATGTAEAVLIRAIEPQFGLESMASRRPVSRATQLTNGPAKLCQALDIRREMDGLDLCDSASAVVIAANPEREAWLRLNHPVVQTTRIGLSQAKDWPLRWYAGGNPFVSKK